MKIEDTKKYMDTLAKKSASANDSGDAVRLSQAACNLANAQCALASVIHLKDDIGDGMTDERIKHMVDRFLGWHLPADFHPDGGVSFRPMGNAGTAHEYKNDPSGTNLLDATQAEAMVRYMIEGLPSALNA